MAKATRFLGDVGVNELKIGSLSMRENIDEGVLEFDSDIPGVTNQIGLEGWIRVHNDTGALIPDGSAVYFSGSFGGTDPTIALASASNFVGSVNYIGLVTSDIANGTEGFITQRGLVRGLDTSGLSLAGALFLSETPGEVTMTKPEHPAKVVVVGGVLNVDPTEGIIYVNPSWELEREIVSRSYSFTSQGIGTGVYYVGGYYLAPATDANLTQASTSISGGTANAPETAHAFAVFGGAGTVDAGVVGLRVSGVSYSDDGTLNPSDTEIITADITSVSVDQYLETVKKWVSTVTWELYTVSGTPTTYNVDFNYGLAKYEDVGNRDFYVTTVDVVGLAGATDTSFNIELMHHSATNWTYSAASFVPGNSVLESFSGDLAPYDNLVNGAQFAWKHTNIDQFIDGSALEGVLFKITVTSNNSVQSMDLHIGVSIDPT